MTFLFLLNVLFLGRAVQGLSFLARIFSEGEHQCSWSEPWSTLDDACGAAFSLYDGQYCGTLTRSIQREQLNQAYKREKGITGSHPEGLKSAR